MTSARLIDDDTVELQVSLQTATILYQLLGRFHPNSSGPLGELHAELDDLGIEPYDNLFILDQNEPVLHLQVVTPELDNDEEEE